MVGRLHDGFWVKGRLQSWKAPSISPSETQFFIEFMHMLVSFLESKVKLVYEIHIMV